MSLPADVLEDTIKYLKARIITLSEEIKMFECLERDRGLLLVGDELKYHAVKGAYEELSKLSLHLVQFIESNADIK